MRQISSVGTVSTALDRLLLGAGYYANKNRELTLEKLRRIAQRADLGQGDIRMLRGVIAQLLTTSS